MLIYADTASLAEIEELDEHPWVSGFTTNPTLAKNAAVKDYARWAKEAVSLTDKPISIDGPTEKVWDLGPNAIAKFCSGVLYRRALGRVNFTAVLSESSARSRANLALDGDIISVFAGRIMDTGRDPQATIDRAKRSKAQVLWASTREVYNYVQAEQAGCDIITMAPALIAKLTNLGVPLEKMEDDTRAQFAADRRDW